MQAAAITPFFEMKQVADLKWLKHVRAGVLACWRAGVLACWRACGRRWRHVASLHRR